MITSWMLYSIGVTGFFGLAAWALEKGIRSGATPTRWCWGGALVASVALSVLALVPASPGGETPSPLSREATTGLSFPVMEAVSRVATPPAISSSFDPWIGAGWIILSLLAMVAVARSGMQLSRLRTSWGRRDVNGRSVLVSESFGPALVGLFSPRIVLPSWALAADPADRELMIRHEEEHIGARDTYLLAAALLLVLVFPWNLPLWWIGLRLQAAVEIDCDHRVLRKNPGVRDYADLLLDIGSRGRTPGLGALAFSRPLPFLERRIRAMTDQSSRGTVRSLGLVLVSALLVVAACELKGPTNVVPENSADIQAEVEGTMASEPDLKVMDLRLRRMGEGGRAAVSGTILTTDTDEPVANAQVEIETAEMGAFTNTEGRFLLLNLPPGNHPISVTHPDFEGVTARVVFGGMEPEMDYPPTTEILPRALPPPPALRPGSNVGVVTGNVTDSETGAAIPSARVSILGLEIGAITNIQGRFLLLNVEPGSHTLRVEVEGAEPFEVEVEVAAGERAEVAATIRR